MKYLEIFVAKYSLSTLCLIILIFIIIIMCCSQLADFDSVIFPGAVTKKLSS